MSNIVSFDPTTGEAIEDVAAVTSAQDVDRIVSAAVAAFPVFESLGRERRAAVLHSIADALGARREDIVRLGTRETGLPEARLHGELTRTVYQARLFAEVLLDGAYVEATIDHASDTPMGPGPDLRRMLVPIGPVAVFGASNFPLAFSVPGGDTVSALAAGNPVVVKAHSSHPALSKLTYEILKEAAEVAGAPVGTLGIVYGTSAGAELVGHPGITAVGFTGSLAGGRALMDIIAQREQPIPFYGELSSINPVIVTEAAAAARGTEIAETFVTSVTASAGQLCTKPGLVLVPRGDAGDEFVRAAAAAISQVPAAPLLNSRIATSYAEITESITSSDGVRVAGTGGPVPGHGFYATAQLMEVAVDDATNSVLEECFGPAAVVIRYNAGEEATTVAALPASLTGTVFSEPEESELQQKLSTLLRPKAGRLLYDQYPTGVLVSWAQHHGGPWPSTNTAHTSVGTTAIRRFLRPVVWQNAPEAVLPSELHEDYTRIPRRVDGQTVLAH